MDVATARRDLMLANRILANEGVLDQFGHVTVRHPERPDHYLMAWARAPQLVEEADLIEFTLDGTPLDANGRAPYLERFIHGAVYEQRPEVMAVCHNHTLSILPFSISKSVKLRAVIHTGWVVGAEAAVWDMADEFGPDTDLLVVNMEQARSLSNTLGQGRLALMRAHGSVVVGNSVSSMVSACIAMDKNAKAQVQALHMGEIIPLSAGEISRPAQAGNHPWIPDRAWEVWVHRAGF
ncbi:MAG TPA: class II aldolase/adducin family protein [Chloroflexota bacterium]|jgi:ribulose-5-phosphate 4-epimerase/fuculose-1-phosphate aldolase|nr:class II aldolase/adducin family protein [Chloroflexota bacterium]